MYADSPHQGRHNADTGLIGRQRIPTDMGSECWLRKGRVVGHREDAMWLSKVSRSLYPDRRHTHTVRFLIHPSIDRLAQDILAQYGQSDLQKAMLFPSHRSAALCYDFILHHHPELESSLLRVLDLTCPTSSENQQDRRQVRPRLSAVLYPIDCWPVAKLFWQHTGEGIQSRRAEYCQKALDEKLLIEAQVTTPPRQRLAKGPRRYQRAVSTEIKTNGMNLNGSTIQQEQLNANGEGLQDCTLFVEERFGRNLDVNFAAQAKLAIRRRIAGSLTSSSDLPDSLQQPAETFVPRSGISTDDVYLFSTGMNAIFTSHRILRLVRGEMKSIMYGFPYVDTLKILEKWGPGAVFYGHCSSSELDELEHRLRQGERFLALYCEFPGNPLLMSPDLYRIRQLADTYDFAVIVDETIGNFLNIHVLPHADIVVSSLTKIFSGDSNVMGGSMILNPQGKYYQQLRDTLEEEYEDNHFEEDSIYLERNSRDFIDRIQRVNKNAEAVADVLRAHPRIKQVHYPKYSSTKQFYDACRLPNGGYGGLLSATFYSMEDAQTFYDNLKADKGPSLGTNFTLASPFVILAHFTELDWAASYGCEASLIRFSIGLEDTKTLVDNFAQALETISYVHSNDHSNGVTGV